MINLIEALPALKAEYGITDDGFNDAFTRFLISNEWFGTAPKAEADGLFVPDGFLENPRIQEYARHYNDDAAGKSQYLEGKLSESMPETWKQFNDYCSSNPLEADEKQRVIDFLLAYLPGEIAQSTDPEIAQLVSDAYDNLPKIYALVLTDFINWLLSEKKYYTAYRNMYFLPNYQDMGEQNGAYDPDYYLKILYCFFNAEYIEENDMYAKAAESADYVDTWLFISLHFLCALRVTDLIRLPHPMLPMPPQDFLSKAAEGTLSESEALYPLYTVTTYLDAVKLTPHKTERLTGVSAIKFHIPVSCERHMGLLFGISESHFQLSGKDPSEPLIRPIRSYEQISRYMGDEIGELFLEADFRSRSANKAFMQLLYILSDDVLAEKNDSNHIKGYILASLARSHKGSYGEFAATTGKYLKDAKMSGLTPEFVAKELFERGVLSSVSSMLLSMILGNDYKKLDVKKQTEAIKVLSMSPLEAEQAVGAMQSGMEQGASLARQIYKSESKDDIVRILHRIGNDEAVSKQNECLCLMTAMGRLCPHPERQGCVGCEYEIGTKSTMLLMASEVTRLQDAYKAAKTDVEKERCRTLAMNIVGPKMADLIRCMGDEYGSEALQTMQEIVRKIYGKSSKQ